MTNPKENKIRKENRENMAKITDEGRLDDLLDLDIQKPNLSPQKLKKKIEFTFYKSILKILVIGGLTVGGLCAAVSGLAYMTCFNPWDIKTLDLDNGNEGKDDFDFLMQVMDTLFMPEHYVYMPAGEANAKKTGFGNYEIPIVFGSVYDDEPVRLGKAGDYIELRWGKMRIVDNAQENLATPFIVGTTFSGAFDEWRQKPEEVIKELEEMPKSAIISVQCLLKNEKSLDALYEFADDLKIDMGYLCTVGPEKGSIMPPLGIGGMRNEGHGLGKAFLEKYPGIQLEYDENVSPSEKAKAKAAYYSASLKVLLDNEEFLDMALGSFGITKLQVRDMKEIMRDESEKTADEITVSGFSESLKRDAMIALLESDEIESVIVKDVKMSIYG